MISFRSNKLKWLLWVSFDNKKFFRHKKNENDRPNHNRSSMHIWPQSTFLPNKLILPVLGILKFSKPDIFVIFGFPSKNFFFWITKLLLFQKKNFWIRQAKIGRNFSPKIVLDFSTGAAQTQSLGVKKAFFRVKNSIFGR